MDNMGILILELLLIHKYIDAINKASSKSDDDIDIVNFIIKR